MTITQIIWNTSMLLLMLFYDKSNTALGTVTLDQLNTVCMYGFPKGFTHDHMPPKEVCSAMGTIRTIPPPQGIDLADLKQGLPHVYVLDVICTAFDYENRVLVVDKSKFNTKDLEREIHDHQVDVLVLSFLEKKPPSVEIPITIDLYIISVYEEIKVFKNDLLIGLMLPSSSPSELMNRLKDSLGDLNSFYVIQTSDTLACDYHKNQSQTKAPQSAANLAKAIGVYKDLGYPSFQIFLTIDVIVKVWKDETFTESWSYSQVCDAKSDPQSTYCKQTLDEINSEIASIGSRGRFPSLGGVFVLYADFDDSKDTCHCGKYPALRVIDSAIKLLPKNDTLVGCKTFGQH